MKGFKVYLSDKAAWIIALVYFLWMNCFNYRGLSGMTQRLSEYKEIIVLGATVYLASFISRSRRSKHIDKNVYYIMLMLLLSIFVALFLWGQDPYRSVRALCSTLLPYITFFVLKKKRITVRTITTAIIILCCIHGLLQIVGTLTFPHQIFGYVSKEVLERSEQDMETRGVLRLAIPGADFVPMVIFMVMVMARRTKKLYFLLIPLAIILLMRGTRTPFFFTMLISIVYFIYNIKRKWLMTVFAVIAFFFGNTLYQNLLQSKEDNVVVNYVQMTADQLESNEQGDEDIRVTMSKYFLFDFNEGNPIKIIFGNGIPGNSSYGKVMQNLSERLYYYVVDVGFVEIFTYFGLLGLFVYGLLLIKIIRTKVPQEGMFAKLTMLYFYIILPTNSMLLSNPIAVAIALYALYSSEINLLRPVKMSHKKAFQKVLS